MRGHVTKRGKVWSAVYDEGRNEEGKRVQRWHGGFRTKGEAETFLSNTLGAIDRGEYVEPAKLTVGAYLEGWLPTIEATLRPSTFASYKMIAEKQIAPRIGKVLLQRLTAAQLDTMYADMLRAGKRSGKGGLSPRSVRYAHAVLRRALAKAARQRLVVRNVADDAEPPELKTPEMRTWTAAELRRFLEYVREDRLYALYLLAGMTGMRRGELLGLRWADVDLDAARASVRQTLIAPGYRMAFSTPKTKRGQRSVALDPGTVTVFRAHRKRQLEERLAFGAGFDEEHDLVFRREDGSPVHPDGFSAAFDRHVAAAELPRIRLHDLRHTHATLGLAAGVHPKVVSERLGHASVSFTLDHYSHAVPALEEEAAATVANLVLGGLG